MVVIGGAGAFDESDSERTAQIGDLVDRAIVPAATSAGAVVITGGTDVGVVRIVGERFQARASVFLLGVAPEGMVAHRRGQTADIDAVGLESHHDAVLLTPGREWGTETEALFLVAESIAGSRRSGVVVLMNGGSIARQEAKVFLQAGWPVATVEGTGRSADDLAVAIRAQQTRVSKRTRATHSISQWGDLSSSTVEVHKLAVDSAETLQRQLAWHLSDALLLKSAYAAWAAYDDAAARGRRVATTIQAGLAALSAALTIGSLAYALFTPNDAWVTRVLIVIPLLAATLATVGDYLLPRHDWTTLRGAAEEALRGIYLSRCGSVDHTRVHPDRQLLESLETIRLRVLQSGTLNTAVASQVRPLRLSNAFDELAGLTVREYERVRIQGQLAYYRRRAVATKRRQLWAVMVGASAAAAATALASDATTAIWVPLAVLLAFSALIVQLRARWQEHFTLYAAAIAGLQRSREIAASQKHVRLTELVRSVEATLQAENAGWLQHMHQTNAALATYRSDLIDP